MNEFPSLAQSLFASYGAQRFPTRALYSEFRRRDPKASGRVCWQRMRAMIENDLLEKSKQEKDGTVYVWLTKHGLNMAQVRR